jgi:hypothetical protein
MEKGTCDYASVLGKGRMLMVETLAKSELALGPNYGWEPVM